MSRLGKPSYKKRKKTGLAKVTKKTFFFKIEVCEKNVIFLDMSENTKENFFNLPD